MAEESKHTNGALLGTIATFSVVILALGTIFSSQISSNADKAKERESAIEKTMLLLDTHNRELLDNYRLQINATLRELDDKLQKEDETVQVGIKALEDLVDRRFTDAGAASENRHLAQQREIDEIRQWFGTPPPLRINGRID